nr:alpha-mannosidase 2-like [Vanessa tameamea]
MLIKVRTKPYEFILMLVFVLGTLRKIVRDQTKMVQRPFHDNNADFIISNKSQQNPQKMIYPRFTQVKSVVHKMERPKISTILSSIDTAKSRSMFSRMNIAKNEKMNPYDLRMARDAITNVIRYSEDNFIFPDSEAVGVRNLSYNNVKLYNVLNDSNFFSSLDELKQHNTPSSEKSPIFFPDDVATNIDNHKFVKGILKYNTDSSTKDIIDIRLNNTRLSKTTESNFDPNLEKVDFLIEETPMVIESGFNIYNKSGPPYLCTDLYEAKADIDGKEKYSHMDIEAPWMVKKQFWSQVYDSRYESLMRNPKWPSLRVILIPRSQVHTIWKRSFESLHNDTVHRIISNVVKKLQFYPNLTFSWNEVSHLSQWWKGARPKSRAVFRRLIKEGRLEITTGTWVEADESTSHIFGTIHQLMEGHQWLQHNLNYSPDAAWLTNSVTHSSTLPYLLSATGISNLVFTNLHYSWQQFLTEYQFTDFIWVQNWDHDKTKQTKLNEAFKKFGNDRYPKHSVLAHYLQFNSAGFEACGPQGEICATEFNFANNNNNLDINTFNVKEKSERLLEQYSKTGSTSSHNMIIAPLGGPFHYEFQTEFDYQYNNYEKIANFVNNNRDIYKATIEFGTSKDYFEAVSSSQTPIPTLKGDFLNFADINDGSPAYWTGLFTSRPQFKILLRRLQSTLRSTEILFSFALNYDVFKTYNASKHFERLLNAREVVARLQDNHVVSGTLTTGAKRYVHSQILSTAKDCWKIQEVAASLLSTKANQNKTYLEKYVYREGEFISSFKSITPGDHIYIFNSLNGERTEVVELMTRHPNIRVIDHNKKDVTIQINPIWKFNYENKIKISKQFFKITFVVVVPPMTLELFKIKKTYDNTQSASTIYCEVCEFDGIENFSFDVRPVEVGDIQIENYKQRLVFDEYSGFLRNVIDKTTNNEKLVLVDFGAFRSSIKNSGIFLFNTNYSKPLEDILSPFRLDFKSKTIMIISGQITTELVSIYGILLQHSVKIFNLMTSPLSDTIKFETKVDYEISPKNRELEIFISIKTDIGNGNPPELTIDNNGFDYKSRIINLCRRIESNMYPMTNMVFIQDHKNRLTVVTDHAQGVTALQEGQIIVMLDRRILFDDGRGSGEGLADNSATFHTHYILLESIVEPTNEYFKSSNRNSVRLPSFSANYFANILNYLLDIFFIDTSKVNLCHYAFRPLVKNSFPCDVTLINYRTILIRGTPEKYSPNTALMTLHRQSFSCVIKHDISVRCNGEETLKLDKTFHNVIAVYQTNLVGTNEGTPVNVLNKDNLPSMEITTLRIYFSNFSKF